MKCFVNKTNGFNCVEIALFPNISKSKCAITELALGLWYCNPVWFLTKYYYELVVDVHL